MKDFYTRENLSDSEVKINITLPGDAFTQSYNKMLKQRLDDTQLKGFRKGVVPDNLVDDHLKQAIMTETFEQIAPYYVNAAVMKEEIKPAAPPKYTDLGDLKENQDVKFTVTLTVIPEFELGDMSKIDVEQEDIEATDEEVENTLKTMWENNQKLQAAKDAENEDSEKEKKAGSDTKKEDFSKDKLDDEWAKSVAETYGMQEIKSLDDLKEYIKKVIMSQKERVIKQKLSVRLLNNLILRYLKLQ
jgi:FKBP-type peptidyl-prolyl cis-trans isomerase (trigger factor)